MPGLQLAIGAAAAALLAAHPSPSPPTAAGAAGWGAASGGGGAEGEEAVPCTLERLERLDAATFAREFSGRKPFILSAGGADATLAHHGRAWARQALLADFGAALVPVGTPISREAVRTQAEVPLREYAEGLLEPPPALSEEERQCRGPRGGWDGLYMFDRGGFFEANPAVMSRIRAPAFLRGDGATPAGGGLAWRGVFALGAQGSGFPFHLHGDAYLELLTGAKRWSIYSMAEVGTPPGGYAESLPHSAWLRDVYAREFDGGSKGGHPPPLECVQRPGEIVCKSALLCFESLTRLQCR